MQLSYAGIQFPSRTITTEHFSEEAHYSEDGLVYEYSSIRIGIQCVVTPQQAADMNFQGSNGSVTGDSPIAVMNSLQAKLLRPRQQLIFADENGTKMVKSPVNGALADVTGGPKTKMSYKLFANQVWIITFEVTTDRYLCDLAESDDEGQQEDEPGPPDSNADDNEPDDDDEPDDDAADDDDQEEPDFASAGPEVLSNRWTTTVHHDKNWFARREVVGTLRLNKAYDPNPDTFRDLVTPALPKGFVREDYSYTTGAGGFTLAYSFTDRQVYTTPPVLPDGTNATVFEGSLSSSSGNGIVWSTDLHFHLEAPIFVNASELFAAAVQIMFGYLSVDGKTLTGTLQACQIVRDLNNNSIDLSMRRLLNTTGASGSSSSSLTSAGMGLDPSIMYQAVPGSTGIAGNPGVNGGKSWIATMAHAGLSGADPCSGTPGKAGVVGDSENQPTQPSQNQPQSLMARLLPDDPGGDQSDESTLESDGTNDNAEPDFDETAEVDTDTPDFSPADLTAGSVYTEYLIDNTYVEHNHNYALPVAGESGPLIVQAAAPIWVKVSKWTAERLGAKPMCPAVDSGDNVTLLKQVIGTCSPVLNPDLVSKTYRVSGVYYYVCSVRPEFEMGIPPYMDESEVSDSENSAVDDFTIDDDLFVDGIDFNDLDPDGDDGDGGDEGDGEGEGDGGGEE